MNPDQRANIDAAARALSETLFSAWTYFHLLRGLHEGAKQHPTALRRFGWFFEQTWRATFDAFFAKVGTLVDATKSTQSLPNLVTLIRRYGDAPLKGLLPTVEAALSAKAGPLAKLKAWRHEIVANRTPSVNDDAFYAANKMKLPEVEAALLELEELFNHLSWNVLGIHNDTRTGSEALVEEGANLFRLIACSLQSDTSASVAPSPE
jgi:hypothetical protein